MKVRIKKLESLDYPLVKTIPVGIQTANSSVPISDHITTLGVILDSNLTLNGHVSSVCKSSYYSIKALRHIRPVLTLDMARAVAASLTQTRLDFANPVGGLA